LNKPYIKTITLSLPNYSKRSLRLYNIKLPSITERTQYS